MTSATPWLPSHFWGPVAAAGAAEAPSEPVEAGPAELEWRAVIQHALNKEPIVFEENQYQEDRMWLELEMKI